jgi:hypothetical protein
VLVLAPRDELQGTRVGAVVGALRGRGVDARLLDEVLTTTPASRRHLSDRAIGVALRRVDRVVVVARSDNTIGQGTVRDLRLAIEQGIPVHVCSSTGRLVELERAGFFEVSGGSKVAARFTWPEETQSS